MAIDYDKIFAGMASREYEWTDTDYKKGMETMGDDPPIRQIFDALFKYQDKKMQDLNNRLKALESVNSQHNIIPRQTVVEGGVQDELRGGGRLPATYLYGIYISLRLYALGTPAQI